MQLSGRCVCGAAIELATDSEDKKERKRIGAIFKEWGIEHKEHTPPKEFPMQHTYPTIGFIPGDNPKEG